MTVAAAKKREIRPLTGIRGFAASLVLLTHLFPMWIKLLPSLAWLSRLAGRGAIGVDLFFILSGFILNYVYFDPSGSRLGWREYGNFLGHRLVRIWPVHVATIALLAVMVLAAHLLSFSLTGNYPISALPFQLTMTHAWPFLPGGQDSDPYGQWTWNYPSWSISAEWFAYLLVFPALWPVLKQLNGRGGFSFLLCYLAVGLWSLGLQPRHALWCSATCAVTLEFAAGALLYNVFCSAAIITKSCQRLATLTFLVVVSALLAVPAHPPLLFSFIVLLFPVLLLGMTSETALISKLFATPPALWLGRVSFSLYMIQALAQKVLKIIFVPEHYAHSPLALRLLLIMGTLALVFALTSACFYLIETPARNHLRRLTDGRPGKNRPGLPQPEPAQTSSVLTRRIILPPCWPEIFMTKVSVIVPCFNEEEVLPALFDRVGRVAASWGADYEILCVDDGSRDRTWPLLTAQNAKDPRWRGLAFARNFGHQTAVSAGLHFATGDAVVVMDADLQDPPEQIARLLEKWREGYEVVYAVRKKRKEGLWKRTCYWVFYRLMAKLAAFDIPLDSGDFCLMSRRVVAVLNAMPERNRFVRGLRAWAGFRQIGLEYERAERAAGEPKYGLKKLFKLAFDGLFSFSAVPLRLATHLGLWVSAIAFLGVMFTLAQKLFAVQFARIGLAPSPGFPTIVISVLFLGGIQLICLGILGEYIGRIYEEVKGRPLWVLRDSAGLTMDPLAQRRVPAGQRPDEG